MRRASALTTLALLIVSCGHSAGEEHVAAGEPPRSALHTATLSPLCGSENESVLRAWLPELPAPCPNVSLVHAVARTDLGTIAAIAWSDERITPSVERTVFVRDGQRLEALPRAHPLDDAQTEAWIEEALLSARGSARLLAQRDESGLPWPYLLDVPLGLAADGRVNVLSETRTEGGEPYVERLSGRFERDELVVERERLVERVDSLRVRVLALEGLPLLARVSWPQAICGDRQEAAVRRRLPQLPPCPLEDAQYLAIETDAGPLVFARWGNNRAEVVGAVFGPTASSQLHGATAEDEHALLSLGVLERWDLRIERDPASIAGTLPAAELARRFRGTPGLSASPRGPRLSVHGWARTSTGSHARVRVYRLDAERAQAGEIRVAGRRLVETQDGIEIPDSEQSEPVLDVATPIPAPLHDEI